MSRSNGWRRPARPLPDPRRSTSGGAVKIGFLLGTRDFRATRTWFAEGERLYVRAHLEYHDAELANFACEVAELAGRAVVGEGEPECLSPDTTPSR